MERLDDGGFAAGGGEVFLVEERHNPSTDHYLLPHAAALAGRLRRCGFDDVPAPAQLQGATVVFVRYVPPHWRRVVDAIRPHLQRLVYFMDDDLLDWRGAAGLPWRYRYKLARLATLQRAWLRRQGAELWVSGAHLQAKYADWRPRVVMPRPLEPATGLRRVFYHGTASHRAEVRWLRPVVAEALRRDERLAFELVGGSEVRRLYRGLPRTWVAHPMQWPAYRGFLAMPGRHIGLAPLLDTPFNRARSHTKFFDITAAGAVGVYAARAPYADVVEDGVDGRLLPAEPDRWVEAILELARDDAGRDAMLGNARRKVARLVNASTGPLG